MVKVVWKRPFPCCLVSNLLLAPRLDLGPPLLGFRCPDNISLLQAKCWWVLQPRMPFLHCTGTVLILFRVWQGGNVCVCVFVCMTPMVGLACSVCACSIQHPSVFWEAYATLYSCIYTLLVSCIQCDTLLGMLPPDVQKQTMCACMFIWSWLYCELFVRFLILYVYIILPTFKFNWCMQHGCKFPNIPAIPIPPLP